MFKLLGIKPFWRKMQKCLKIFGRDERKKCVYKKSENIVDLIHVYWK